MAISYAHRLGQIIGESLENALEPFLREFAEKHSLYFDKKEFRIARSGTKLTWIDINNNKHDLDFVFEKDGTPEHTGKPVAFIECAWRRYTKHSRNKAQEIQGAIMPLFEKYKKDNPFIGAILAGVFTDNSLKQLQSLGFTILYFPYEMIVNAFRIIEIDVYFEENTTEEYFAKQIALWEKLNDAQKGKIYRKITEQNLFAINQFMSSLQLKLDRRISRIHIWMMYGKQYIFDSIEKAKEFIVNININDISPEFNKYEAEIQYSNGDIVKVEYRNQNDMLGFLSSFI
ncbi:MAG: hypothetical protein LBB48_10040 [Treponema sp.]|jgi:hypothetical protein|nr:hypothetical protein [Treponema sp.]